MNELIAKAFPLLSKSFWYPLLLGLAISLIAIFLLPFQPVIPRALWDVTQILQEGSIAHRFTPVGYPVLILPGYLLCGENGIVITQAAVYVVFLVTVHKNLCSLIEGNHFFIFAVITILAFHPYLILNIVRINDNAVNIIFIALLLPWVIRGSAAFENIRSAVFYGGMLALYVVTRPNAILLSFVVIFTLRQDLKRCFDDHSRLIRYLIFLATAVFIYSSISFIGTGQLFYWPSNGPYNLFAGNNPYTIDVLLTKGNAEDSIAKGLAYHGVNLDGRNLWIFDQSLYVKYALDFMVHNVLDTFRGWAVKLWVFFAPDFRQADNNFEKIIQVTLATPVIVWCVSILFFLSTSFPLKKIAASLLFIFLFIFPFILTNSDARFRLPVLDVFFIVHSAWLIEQFLYEKKQR